MSTDGLVKNLVSFFKTSRHLWGRCPSCGDPFRLSDVAISSSRNPPRDWLRKIQRQQADLMARESEIEGHEDDLEFREEELKGTQRDSRHRELTLEREAVDLHDYPVNLIRKIVALLLEIIEEGKDLL